MPRAAGSSRSRARGRRRRHTGSCSTGSEVSAGHGVRHFDSRSPDRRGSVLAISHRPSAAGARKGALPMDVTRAESLAAVAGGLRMNILTTVRLAFRSLRRRPAYAAVVVSILGLGIGANTAIFSVFDAVLLRSLPYDRPESLVVIFADGTARGQGGRVSTTPADFFEWRADAASTFDGLAALRNVSHRITSLDTPVVPLIQAVTANYFDVLGARPFLGRTFHGGDDAPERDALVVLSYGLWRSAFGADEGVVGRAIALDGKPHVVAG